ncbi:hypothetical protein CDV31_007280 [Fusarium ambrosium]|uniref:Protein kinase domain-containing protein n=1 Tax=Fusarium ambrosium TaxID=131363 RepID=A0A428U7N2_9HYPO|nr:hypothetical protein CDV31_007280 [Fusarium ambrosium]
MRPEEIHVRTVMVPDNRTLHRRNILAVQSAIIRGDTEVLLHNWSVIPASCWEKVRHDNRHLNKTYKFPYSERRLVKRVPPHLDDATARLGIDDVQWRGLRFEFIKILACGGHGYVSLWRVWFEDGSSKKVVIKRALNSHFTPELESRYHLRYAGAEHTCQILDLHTEAMRIQDQVRQRNPLARLRYRNGSYFDAESLELIVFEFMEHGDMSKLLAKAGHEIVYFSDRALWGIWECLVRGVAAVAYVPAFRAVNRDFDKELQTAIDTNRLEPFLALLENIQQSHDVHLDMEELNILVGTADSHPHKPIFKLHDLGAFSYTMTHKWRTWDDHQYWRMRAPCKTYRVTPEQVHEDWDQLRTDEGVNPDGSQFAGEDLTQGHPIAGRFGTWTNVFLIGKMMEAAITSICEAYPFEASHWDSMDGTQSGDTYGWLLQDPIYSYVDPSLRDLVMRCQLEMPGERPSITTLLREIAIRKFHPFHDSAEDMAYEWEEFFGPKAPSPIPDPLDDDVTDSIEASMAGGMLFPAPTSQPHQHEHQAESAPAERLEYFQQWIDRQARAPVQRKPAAGGHGQHRNPRQPGNLRVPQRIARRPIGGQPAAAAPCPDSMDVDEDEDAQEDAAQFWARGRDRVRRARTEADGSVSESGSDISAVSNARKGVTFDVPKGGTWQGKAKKTGSIYDKNKRLLRYHKEPGSRVNKRVSEPNPKSLKTGVKMGNLDKFAKSAMDDMPMAIRNLMARTKHLDQRLADGNLPAWAYITAGGK